MPDSSAINRAILAKLGGDATLLSYVPNGVYWREAPQGFRQFVIVSLIIGIDEPMLGARAFEDDLYLIKAVVLGTSRTTAEAAAARIDALLDNQPLTVTGYSHMLTQREERIDDTEVDDVDPSIRWQHIGGHYRVMVST